MSAFARQMGHRPYRHDNVYYNGNGAKDFVTIEGVKKLRIEKGPPIVTHGVVLDMVSCHRQYCSRVKEFSVADLKAVL